MKTFKNFLNENKEQKIKQAAKEVHDFLFGGGGKAINMDNYIDSVLRDNKLSLSDRKMVIARVKNAHGYTGKLLDDLNEEQLDEATTKINTKTWNIHKASVTNLKQELLKGSNARFAERVKSIVKQEVTNYGWKITCLMDDGNEVSFAMQVKELDVSQI